MSKVKFDNYEFERPNKMQSPEDFVWRNLGYYSKKFAEEYPDQAYKVNDGDTDSVIDVINMEDVKEDMAEVYIQFLDDNY